MKDLIEIRWHGRGGQGAKTAALLLADVAFSIGKEVQGFPEYGPERMGAPITAYNRISDNEIRVHSNIYDPDFVAVVDETLLNDVDVTKGLSKDGGILVNTEKSKEDIIPFMPMLAAMVKITGVMEEEVFISEMQKSLEHKFAKKPEVLEGNMKALKVAFKEVK